MEQSTQEWEGMRDREFLVLKLDRLLEEYLRTLDAYQQAQQQLTKHLSSGFMSLAQANFSNNTRTRYGQDYYDGRMQATRKIAIQKEEGLFAFTLASGVPTPSDEDTTEEFPLPKEEAPENNPTKDHPEEDPKTPTAPKEEGQESDSENPSPPPDPIRWFGVLVPPALRSAQKSFVTAVEGPVIELFTLERDMRQHEIEIGRVRKQLKKCYSAYPSAPIR